MQTVSTDNFEEKDVIDVGDGKRIGCVTALEFDPCDGRITGIVVSGDAGLFGFGKREKTLIPWCKIKKIGQDVILVDADGCPPLPPPRGCGKKHGNC